MLYLLALWDPQPRCASSDSYPVEKHTPIQNSCWQVPHLAFITIGQRRFCEEINIPLCLIRKTDWISCSYYRSLNWLYCPFLSNFLTCLLWWAYSLVKRCQLSHTTALLPVPSIWLVTAVLWPEYHRVLFLLEQPLRLQTVTWGASNLP